MNFYTTGQLAAIVSERVGRMVALHKVLYRILASGIKPCGSVGRYRLFDEAAVEQLVKELS